MTRGIDISGSGEPRRMELSALMARGRRLHDEAVFGMVARLLRLLIPGKAARGAEKECETLASGRI